MFRPTADLDLLGYGEDSIERFERVFRELAHLEIDLADGLSFAADSVRATAIRDEQEYQGKRVVMTAHLGTIPIKLQIDIGIGDIITPGPESLLFPSLLDMPQTLLRASTRETVIAEKLHVMIDRGLLNSRLKDYFDMWVLARRFSFDALGLRTAIAATFARRRTDLPATLPQALTTTYAQMPGRAPAWKRISRSTEAMDVSLEEAIADIAAFLEPVLTNADLTASWPPGGPWHAS